ncbi:cytochrome P450 71A8-like [Salvia miltiorrhiza]|uniref:cytochrome P450 71A8-like n=1 Tax=Salvia miltiorrhiza TaxID=226208 RepID=UPI0025AC1D5F|nr:cytochrome P450 71A8-like [Salvia miltiorrhiza]
MEEFKINLLVFITFAILLWSISKWLLKPSGSKNRPPSPQALPVLGNLHQLSLLPHRDFLTLSKKHGPFMLLHFGRVPVLVASSADAASEIMKNHDISFADRPLYKAHRKILYNGRDVVFAPYGEYWRQARGNFVLKLLSNKRVQSFRPIREEETALLVRKIRESSGAVNLSHMFFKFTYDGVCRSAFGRTYSESEKGSKFLVLMTEMTEALGAISIGEFIPWLRWVDRITGFDKKVERIANGLDGVLESVIQERLENLQVESNFEEKSEVDFLDILLQIYSEGGDVSGNRDTIKAIILDVFGAGTDTSAVVLEWTMTELLRHPTAMQKLQDEVRGIIGQKRDLTEDDIDKMHYLKAVIKESLRLHPPFPLLLPRVATRDVKVKGYDVVAGTVVMVSVWAIGRDPELWDEPQEFMPERFLNSSIDFKGLDFELIPFGAGRRGCPGITYSITIIEFLVANLVAKFDWELPDGVKGKDLDMNEGPGITAHRVVPLHAVATVIS